MAIGKTSPLLRFNWVGVPYMMVAIVVMALAGLCTTARWAKVKATWTIGPLPTAVVLDVGLLDIDATVQFPIPNPFVGTVDSVVTARSNSKFDAVKDQLPQQQKGSLEALALDIISIIMAFSFFLFGGLVFLRRVRDHKYTHCGAIGMTALQAIFLGATFLHWKRNVADVQLAPAPAAGTGTGGTTTPVCNVVTLNNVKGCWVGEGSTASKGVTYIIFALIATFAQFVACVFAMSFVTCCSADTWLYSGTGIFVGKINPAPARPGAHQRTSPGGADGAPAGAGVGAAGAVAVGGDYESSAAAGLHQRRRPSGSGTTIEIRPAGGPADAGGVGPLMQPPAASGVGLHVMSTVAEDAPGSPGA